MAKIQLLDKAKKTYEKLVKDGSMKVITGKANYELVEPLLKAPIPKDMLSLESESRNGKKYQFGELLRIDTDEPILASQDFPFAHGEKDKFEDCDNVMIGIYRLREDIKNDDGSIKVPAGKHTLRAACL